MNGNRKKSRIGAALALALLAGCGALLAQGGGFDFRGPLSRIITPNGDLRNDYAIFCLDNPSDSGVDGKVYALSGRLVSSMVHRRGLVPPPPGGGATPVACPAGALANSPQYVFWDGKAEGAAVASGVYVYQIKAEGRSFTGTLVVVR